MGSPEFALASLSALNQHFEVTGVITQPDRPAGRGRKTQSPPVKLFAQANDLPVLQPNTLADPEISAKIQAMKPDVIVVAAYGKILRTNILNLAPFGCVNVHASLLPRWRGAAPVQAAILNDDVTGVTIMKMDQGLDTGPVLSQKSLPIPNDMTAGVLFDQLAGLGALLLIETLPKYLSEELQPINQEDSKATYAPRLTKKDGEIDFNQPAAFLARQVRAYNPWPGSFSYLDHVYLKVSEAHAVEYPLSIPSKRYIFKDKPAWGTQDGLLVLDTVQAAGKAQMTGKEFLRGYRNWENNMEHK